MDNKRREQFMRAGVNLAKGDTFLPWNLVMGERASHQGALYDYSGLAVRVRPIACRQVLAGR